MLSEKIKKLQKNNNIGRDTFFEIIINRISFFVLIFLIKINLFKSPNQITLFSFAIGLLSIYMINIDYKYLGSPLLALYIILDFVDGDFARYKNMKSRVGKIIDQFCDRIIFTLIIITNFLIIDYSYQKNLIFLLITIFPVIYYFDFLSLRKKINEKNIIKKNNNTNNLSIFNRVYNYFLRPTFSNIICFFILATLTDLNFYFSILIASSCILITFKNLYTLIK